MFYGLETAVIMIINGVLWNMKNKEVTSLLEMDLSTAFDTDDPNTLLLVLFKNDPLAYIIRLLLGQFLSTTP